MAVESRVAGEALGAGWSQPWEPAGNPGGLWEHLEDLCVSGRWDKVGPKGSTRTRSSCGFRAEDGEKGDFSKGWENQEGPQNDISEGTHCHRVSTMTTRQCGGARHWMAFAGGSPPWGQGKGSLCVQGAI